MSDAYTRALAAARKAAAKTGDDQAVVFTRGTYGAKPASQARGDSVVIVVDGPSYAAGGETA